VIEEREKLFVQSAEEFGTRYGIDVRVNTEVLSIHPEEKLVKAKNLITGETYEETYDKLILSPGADPIVPPLPGIKSDVKGVELLFLKIIQINCMLMVLLGQFIKLTNLVLKFC
jgi:NADPH-dependent 2,4-dienoyl-CoA reductase/sulfur reductase-like enzyme